MPKDPLARMLRSDKVPEAIRLSLKEHKLTLEEYVRYRRLKPEDRLRLIESEADWVLRCLEYEKANKKRVRLETQARAVEATEAVRKTRDHVTKWWGQAKTYLTEPPVEPKDKPYLKETENLTFTKEADYSQNLDQMDLLVHDTTGVESVDEAEQKDIVAELSKLADLKKEGLLSSEQFERAKNALLNM